MKKIVKQVPYLIGIALLYYLPEQLIWLYLRESSQLETAANIIAIYAVYSRFLLPAAVAFLSVHYSWRNGFTLSYPFLAAAVLFPSLLFNHFSSPSMAVVFLGFALTLIGSWLGARLLKKETP